jgi:hypothetical protein
MRPEFETALRFLARITERLISSGFPAPVLVGGGAVELFSNGLIATGDFDISTARQSVFEEELQLVGFLKPSGPGVATRGWMHPDFLLGFEVVSSTLLDGLADRGRLVRLDLGADGRVYVLSIEDMIADRMGQFASGTAPEMREQARVLLALHGDVDRDYLDRRIKEETSGDLGIEDV